MPMFPERVRSNPWVQAGLILCVLIAGFGFVFWIRDILLPFFLAFLIAYMLDPLVDWFEEKLHLGRTPAVILLLGLISLFLLGFSYYLVDQAIEFFSQLGDIAENPPDITEWYKSIVPVGIQEYLSGYITEVNPQQLLEQALNYLRDNFSTVTDTLKEGSTYLWMFATQTFGAVGTLLNLAIVLIVAIYLLRDFDDLVAYAHTLIPHSQRDRVVSIFHEIDELMRAFFRGHLIVCLIIGILYGGGYELVGLDGGFLIGFLSGLMNIIPYLGPATGFIVALGMALYQFGLEVGTLGIILVYVLVQSFEGNFLTPNIVGEAVGLNPVIVLFSLMVFGKIFGFLGLLLAIPLAAIVKVLLGRVITRYRNSEYFGAPKTVD